MIFRTLYADELRGFARSKVMVALWLGLPLLAIILKLLRPDTEGVPLLTFVAVMIGSIGGTLSSVLLSTMITGERIRHVYDLFLVRPVPRTLLLLSKYLAALTCLVAAAGVSLGVAYVVDLVTQTSVPGIGRDLAESLLVSVAGMAIASAVGVLFGVLINSIAVSAILSVYLGNQLSAVIVLPTVFMEDVNVPLIASLVGVLVPLVLLAVAALMFNRKSL